MKPREDILSHFHARNESQLPFRGRMIGVFVQTQRQLMLDIIGALENRIAPLRKKNKSLKAEPRDDL
jgi:hypothetical protein